jgi:hypothetical protein
LAIGNRPQPMRSHRCTRRASGPRVDRRRSHRTRGCARTLNPTGNERSTTICGGALRHRTPAPMPRCTPAFLPVRLPHRCARIRASLAGRCSAPRAAANPLNRTDAHARQVPWSTETNRRSLAAETTRYTDTRAAAVDATTRLPGSMASRLDAGTSMAGPPTLHASRTALSSRSQKCRCSRSGPLRAETAGSGFARSDASLEPSNICCVEPLGREEIHDLIWTAERPIL